jgi:hypothetical protein
MEAPSLVGVAKKITTGHMSLKPDDEEQLDGIEPGMMVKITIMAEVRSVEKRRNSSESKETEGYLDFDAKELRVVRGKNAFEDMASDDD